MKIISGGQTGVDQIGLAVAKDLGIETGGCAPRGYRTETGPCMALKTIYGLMEHNSSEYNPRTEMNIMNSDITLLFGDVSSPGSIAAKNYCRSHFKRLVTNPTVEQIKTLIAEGYKVFNIAGNRNSRLPIETAVKVHEVLTEGFS